MKLSDLKDLDLYLGTPYSKYPAGIEQAFIDACKLCGDLLRRGLKVYSPIAHTHPIAIHAGIDPLDLGVWLPFDEMRMERADAMLVGKMPTWEISSGIRHEIDAFKRAGKPVYYLDPAALDEVSAQ
jgi:hypothetical protein